jgi:hypothetical protein
MHGVRVQVNQARQNVATYRIDLHFRFELWSDIGDLPVADEYIAADQIPAGAKHIPILDDHRVMVIHWRIPFKELQQ